MREKVALNEAGASYGDWWGARRAGRERIVGVGSEERASVSVRASRLGAVDGPREWWAVVVRTRTQGSGMVQPAAVTRTMSRAAGWLMG
jgi:hypothetical protein